MLASILAGKQYRQERQTVGLLMLPRILAGRQYRQERQTFGQTDTRHALRLGSLFIYECYCTCVYVGLSGNVYENVFASVYEVFVFQI